MLVVSLWHSRVDVYRLDERGVPVSPPANSADARKGELRNVATHALPVPSPTHVLWSKL